MKKLISLGILAAVIAVLSLVAAPSLRVQAITPTEAQCTTAQERLTTRISKVEALKVAQTKIYANLQTKLDTIISSATENGYDTTDLITAQESFVAKLTTYTEKTTALSDALIAAKAAVCTSTNAEFVQGIVTARRALTAARVATADVRLAFRGDVITELKNYATWLRDQASGEGAN